MANNDLRACLTDFDDIESVESDMLETHPAGDTQSHFRINRAFIVHLTSNFVVNLDHGILPAAISTLKNEFGFSNSFVGLLGSTVFAGLLTGSFFAGLLLTYCKTKILLEYCFVLLSVAILAFPLVAGHPILMLISRFTIGFFQMFLVIYFPVWVDKFGSDNKTIWMSCLQLAVPLGVFSGYILTAFIENLSKTHTFLSVLCE